MMKSRNGQSQSEREQSKPRGRFTGQRLKLLRPETYRQAVELLAEPRPQVPYDHICRLLHVSEHTLKAIERAESLSIAERKQRLLDKALRIASKAADRVEDQIDGANMTQATVAFGVATEKMMLLLGEAAGGVPVHINLNVGAEALHQRYFEMVAEIKELSRQNKDALPNGRNVFGASRWDGFSKRERIAKTRVSVFHGRRLDQRLRQPPATTIKGFVVAGNCPLFQNPL